MQQYEGQQRLVLTAYEAFAIQALWSPAYGWQLMVNGRRGGDLWSDEPAEHYSGLNTEEFVDTLAADLSYRLGL